MNTRTTSNAFGTSVSNLLTEAGLTKAELAARLGKSPAYISQTTTGVTKPSARWVNMVADVLKLTPEQRYNLHMDAAMDHGFFTLDLTKPDSVR